MVVMADKVSRNKRAGFFEVGFVRPVAEVVEVAAMMLVPSPALPLSVELELEPTAEQEHQEASLTSL